MGLEILRNVPLINAARRSGWHVRVWTFHPLAFDDCALDIIPLQQGHNPLLPLCDADAHIQQGAFWLPHSHPNGPYVCHWALEVARKRRFKPLEAQICDLRPGAYPAIAEQFAKELFGCSESNDVQQRCPLYPADAEDVGEANTVVLNLIGAHGNQKGLSQARLACEVAFRIGNKFPDFKFILLLHSRVCAGQSFKKLAPNVVYLIHQDCDSRVSRLLSKNRHVITVEGGLAHSVIHRGGRLTVIGEESWLNSTAYLYPEYAKLKRRIMQSFSEDEFVRIITECLDSIIYGFHE